MWGRLSCPISKEAKFLSNLIYEIIGKREPIKIYNDQSAQFWAQIDDLTSEHIDVRNHFVREAVDLNIINLHYVRVSLVWPALRCVIIIPSFLLLFDVYWWKSRIFLCNWVLVIVIYVLFHSFFITFLQWIIWSSQRIGR